MRREPEFPRPCVSESVRSSLEQNLLQVGAKSWRAYNVPNSIQAGEHSMAGGMGGFSHACGPVLVNVNWNDADRNWNVNYWNPDDNVNAGRRATRTVLLRLPRGSFRFQTSLPTADHAPKFVSFFR